MIFIRFYLYLVALTLIQIGIVLGFPHVFYTNECIKAILFLGLITGLSYPIANIGVGSKDGFTFISSAYLSIGIRLVLSMVYIVYYKLAKHPFNLSFIFTFFATYIFYTIFEIIYLTAKLRPNSKEKTSSNDSDN